MLQLSSLLYLLIVLIDWHLASWTNGCWVVHRLYLLLNGNQLNWLRCRLVLDWYHCKLLLGLLLGLHLPLRSTTGKHCL